jgi:hypothetical protein
VSSPGFNLFALIASWLPFECATVQILLAPSTRNFTCLQSILISLMFCMSASICLAGCSVLIPIPESMHLLFWIATGSDGWD